MRDDRLLRVLRPALALVALAALLVVLGLAITGPARAATASAKPKATKSAKASTGASTRPVPLPSATVQRGAEVRAGEDVVVPAGDFVPSVTAFGGDITVDGEVRDTVVAFGGDVVIRGSVGGSVTAFGGDITINGPVGATVVAMGGNVRLGNRADVGAKMAAQDAAVVVIGGDLKQAPGAQVHGRIKHSAGGFNPGEFAGYGVRGLLFNPLLGLSFFGWVIQTAFFLVLALVAAALMPKHLRRIQDQVARRPWASLGWGALAFLVAVPVIFLVLAISIIGLLLWLPLGVFMLLLYFFGTTAVAAFLAQKVLRSSGGRESLMLAVALGVVATTVVSRIPVAGALAVLVMIWIGTGGTILAFNGWRRERREAAAAQAAAVAAATAQYAAAGAAQPAVINPIVQTSPAQQAPQPAYPAGPPQPPVPQPPAAGQDPPTQPVPAPQPPAGPEPPVAPAGPQVQTGPPAAADGSAGAVPQEGGETGES
jgi:hypothetical protein